MKTITEQQFRDEFLIYKELSKGKQYRTYTAMVERSDSTPITLVLKEMSEKRAAVYESLTEMWNPYIAETYEVINIGEKYIAVTEYVCAEGCDKETLTLSQYVKEYGTLPVKSALFVCVQICEGLEKFHNCGFVHRDLKPDNIMISDCTSKIPKIKIIDFGGAKAVDNSHIADTTVIGTLGYQAPETISTYAVNRSDIYSIGCILNFLLTGQDLGITKYKDNHYIVSIIEKATNEDSSHRYANVTEMIKALRHEMGVRLIDRVPVLRILPGFRTHTFWKEIIGAFSYISMIYILFLAFKMFGIYGLFEVLIFYFISPLIIVFNMGNLLRFVPLGIRKDNRKFMIFRTVMIWFSIFAPIIVDSLRGVM
ncbi:MAG: serine/threonine protein kinase [Clostridia bacterium]|nr:serine/threonine protein kinase [Clostridia bacterium]